MSRHAAIAAGIRFCCAAFAMMVLVASASPARADEPNGTKAARSAASIDDLKASDAELLGAIATLDREVASQQLKVASAQQFLGAANQALQTVEQDLALAQSKLDALKGVAADRAVEEYMRPHNSDASKLLGGGQLGDISRRVAILQQVTANDYTALDELRAVRADLKHEQSSALSARKLADDRRQNEQQELDRLNATRADKSRLEASLQERITAYAGEDEAAARVSAASQGRASRGGGDGGLDGRVSAAGLGWPTADHKINSPFGYRWGRLHAGIDIEAKIGTSIYAAKGGTVTYASWESGYGNYTCIDHGGGFSTCYAHQSSFKVAVGDSVQAGQLIGYSGNTGSSQGAHLHFETRVNGTPKDPMQYLP